MSVNPCRSENQQQLLHLHHHLLPGSQSTLISWLESADIHIYSCTYYMVNYNTSILTTYVNLNRIERWPNNYVIAISISNNISANRKEERKKEAQPFKTDERLRKRVWIYFPKYLEILPRNLAQLADAPLLSLWNFRSDDIAAISKHEKGKTWLQKK